MNSIPAWGRNAAFSQMVHRIKESRSLHAAEKRSVKGRKGPAILPLRPILPR